MCLLPLRNSNASILRKPHYVGCLLSSLRVPSSKRYASGINPLPVDSENESDRKDATWKKVLDAVSTTTATLVCIGIAGYSYHKYYKWITLRKIEKAFQPGDPALDLIPRVIEQTGKETPQGDDNSHFVTRFAIYDIS